MMEILSSSVRNHIISCCERAKRDLNQIEVSERTTIKIVLVDLLLGY